MTTLKRTIAIFLSAFGGLWALLGILMLIQQIDSCNRWGFDGEWKLIIIILLFFVCLGTVICLIGVMLLRKCSIDAGNSKNPRILADPLTKGHQQEDMKEYTQQQTKEQEYYISNVPKVHIYNSSLHLQAAEFLKKLIIIEVIFFFINYMANFPVLIRSDVKLPGALIALIPSVILASSWAFYWCNIRVEIDASGLRIFRGRHKYGDYPIHTNFRPQITKKKLNGLFIGTTREFIIPVSSRCNKMLNFRCIKNADFSDLVEDVNKLRRDGTLEKLEKKQTTEQIYNAVRYSGFMIPKHEILSNERRRLITIIICVLGIGFIMVALWFGLLYKGPVNNFALTCMAFIAFLPGSVGGPVQIGRYLGFARKFPERIMLSDSSIRIDEKWYAGKEIRCIVMTPVNYAATKNEYSFRRRMVLEMTEDRVEYQLGSTLASPKNLIYEDYEKLVMAVKEWCVNREILFRLDRE